MDRGFREEVLNIMLAELLGQRGIATTPERSGMTSGKRHIPDVLVRFQGLRLIIEGEVDDQPGCEKSVISEANERVERGIAHIALAILYPAMLRKLEFHELKKKLSTATLRIAICDEVGQSGWSTGTVDNLGDMLRRTFEQLVQEDAVAEAVKLLEVSVDHFTQAVSGTPAVSERWAKLLGIGGRTPDGKSAKLSGGERIAACSIAALVVANAMIFQEVLSQSYQTIEPLRKNIDDNDVVSR